MQFPYPFLLVGVFFATHMMTVIASENFTPIASCDDLQNITDMTGQYYLSANIDCENKPFTPIGAGGAIFSGTLDGGIYDINGEYTGENYTIANLLIEADPDREDDTHRGLFWQLGSLYATSQAVIKNINFNHATVYSFDTHYRALLAAKAESAKISNIHVTDLKVWSAGNKKDYYYAAGLIAYANRVHLENVHITNITLQKNLIAGGLIGLTMPGTIIEKSSVQGLDSGGAECINYYMAPYACAFGGLIGYIADNKKPHPSDTVKITESFAAGRIDTKHNIGGLVGTIAPFVGVTIMNSYSDVRLVPNCQGYCDYAGGLIGRAYTEQNEYPIILEKVYAIGKVEPRAEYHSRAIIGHKHQSGSTRIQGTESYFDTQTVQKNHSGDKISTSLTTAQMQDADGEHFMYWDRSIWDFEESHYPQLLID